MGNPLQFPCLENSMDEGVWQSTVHGVEKSQIQLSNFTSLLEAERGLSGSLVVKSPPANAGDLDLTPGQEDPLEKEMATHSSILALKIP